MIIGVPRETFPGECRVALNPATVSRMVAKQLEVMVESGAGTEAHYLDQAYVDAGATIATAEEVFAKADAIFMVRALGADPDHATSLIARMREGQMLVATMDPLGGHPSLKEAAEKKLLLFALELIPRITRGQSMDVLSSMATIAGYKAVMMATAELPRLFPMMMTAAGTLKAARVLVLGAGVAGLQAIASARKNGAIVEAYDIRPAVKEQIESLGGRFVELDLDTKDAEDKGGYAKEMGDDFVKRQQAELAKHVAKADVVISTAAIPGRKAPLLITEEAVRGMNPGSVIVDLAAETGGNCALTKMGERVVENGVVILGPVNLPTTVPTHASDMFARNLQDFLFNMWKKKDEGMELVVDLEDEITAGTLFAKDGEVKPERARAALGLPALENQEG